jgi:valyl-tRNA synthetase
VLDRSLRLLHPVMPFLTEEVWQRLPGHQAIHPQTICLAPYPQREPAWEAAAADVEAPMDTLLQVVARVRSLRTELSLPPKANVTLYLAAGEGVAFLRQQESLLRSLCRLAAVETRAAAAPGAVGSGAPGAVAALPAGAARERVAGIDLALAAKRAVMGGEESERLRRELEKLVAEIQRAEARLANADFVAKAPAAVVEGGRARLAELREREAGLRASLESAA